MELLFNFFSVFSGTIMIDKNQEKHGKYTDLAYELLRYFEICRTPYCSWCLWFGTFQSLD